MKMREEHAVWARGIRLAIEAGQQELQLGMVTACSLARDDGEWDLLGEESQETGSWEPA